MHQDQKILENYERLQPKIFDNQVPGPSDEKLIQNEYGQKVASHHFYMPKS